MIFDALEKQIKDGSFESVYFFYGPDEYLKQRAISAIRRTILPTGLEALNEVVLEGCSAREIMDHADTMPVMCDRRLVVVRDWAPLVSGKNKADEKELEAMMTWLNNPPETCVLIFKLSVEVDEKRKGLQGMLALPGAVRFSSLEGNALLKICSGILKENGGKKLQREAFDELTERAGNDLMILSGELSKLSAYIGDAKEITAEDVRKVVTPSPEFIVFQILDHLLAGDLKTASLSVEKILQDSSMNPVRLINTLASQLRTDLYVKCVEGKPDEQKQLLSYLKISPYRVKYITRSIRSVSEERLRRCYLLCTETVYAITSGRVAQQAALDDLIFRLSRTDRTI